MIVSLAILFLITMLIYQLFIVEPLTSSPEEEDENVPPDDPSPSLSAPLAPTSSTTTTTIETNMLSLNNQMNDLRLKYEDLSGRVSKLQKAAELTTEKQSEASDLVGDAPIKIDTSK
jgi:hypothetical protein